MSLTLSRTESPDQRFFPEITTNPYTPSPENEHRAAGKVLVLAQEKMSRKQRLGKRSGLSDSLRRLLYLHHNAIVEEQAGHTHRADFWWKELESQWEQLPGEHPDWEWLFQELQSQGKDDCLPDSSTLRSTIARELLLDTHLAFHNGLLQDSTASRAPDRARQHFEMAQPYVKDACLTKEDEVELRAQPLLQEMAIARANEQWDAALGIAETLQRDYPNHRPHLNLLAGLYREARDAKLADKEWLLSVGYGKRLCNLLPEDKSHRRTLVDIHRQGMERCKAGMDWTQAVALAESLEALRNPDSPDSRRPHRLLQEGIQTCTSARDWEQAIELATQLLQRDPENGKWERQLVHVHEQAIQSCESFQNWDAAIKHATSLAHSFPNQVKYQDRLVDLHFKIATEHQSVSFAGSKEEQARQEASQIIQPRIQALEDVLREFPNCHPAYEALAVLHYLQSIQLANGDRPSDAALAVAKALAYKPGWDDAHEAEKQIQRLLTDLQRQIREAGAQHGVNLQSQPWLLAGANRELRDLFDQSKSGNSPRDQFRRSREPERIQRESQIARGRHFWLRTALPIPDENWDAQAAKLLEAVDLLQEKDPETATDLITGWIEILAERPDLDLTEHDPWLVFHAFLTHDEEDGDEEQEQDQPLEDDWEELETETEDSAEADGPEEDTEQVHDRSIPMLVPSTRGEDQQKDAVPFENWFYTRRSRGTRLALLAAGLALLLVGALGLREYLFWKQRDEAWKRLKTASASLDVEGAKQAIATFREAKPFADDHSRLEILKSIEQEIPRWPALRQRNDTFQQLQQAVRKYDDQAARDLGNRFLSIEEAGSDPRTPWVRQTVDQAIELPLLKTRDQAYRAIQEATKKGEDKTVVEQADRFLAHLPKKGVESRIDQVKQLRMYALEAPAFRKRDQAYAHLIQAMEARPIQYEKAIESADVFLASPPKKIAEYRTEHVRQLRQHARETPKRRLRDAAYERLKTAVTKEDPSAAQQAAVEFLNALPESEAEPRTSQVRAIQKDAREWTNRRVRTRAFSEMVRARKAQDLNAVLLSAEQFFNAPPVELSDLRTTQVQGWYAEAFSQWILEQPLTLSADAQKRVSNYRKLIPDESD